MKYKRKKATFGVLAPNIQRGGMAIPLGNNLYWMKGRKHKTGGIDIGKDLEVENNEVMQMLPNETRVFSSVKMLGGNSPAELVASGVNPNMVFNAQEAYKRINRIRDDGSRYKRGGRKKAKEGTNKDEINIDLPGITVYQPIQKEIPNFIEQAIYETGSKLEDVWNIPGMPFSKKAFDKNGRLTDDERTWLIENGDIYKDEPLKYSVIRKILDENETKFAINAFGELVPKSVIMDKARELEHAWRMENDRAYRDKIEHNDETYEQYYDRMQNAPIASNVDLDKEMAWQYDQNDLDKQQIEKNKADRFAAQQHRGLTEAFAAPFYAAATIPGLAAMPGVINTLLAAHEAETLFGGILGGIGLLGGLGYGAAKYDNYTRYKDRMDEINSYLSTPWVRNAIEQARRNPEKSRDIMSQIRTDWILGDYEKYKNGNLPIIKGSSLGGDGTPQNAFLLDRDVQRDYMLKHGYTEAPGDYGLVRKAVGDRNIPVYQQMSDVITRDKLTPIGNLFNHTTYNESNPAWLANSDNLEHAGDYPTALYVDKDGNFYQKAWDLNDYSGGKQGINGVGLDLVGNPIVVTTGFQPVDKSKILELEHNDYFEPTEEWEGALSRLKQQSKKYGGKQMNLQNVTNNSLTNNKRMISPNKLGTIVRVDGNGRDRLAYIPSTGSSKQDMKCGGRVKAFFGSSLNRLNSMLSGIDMNALSDAWDRFEEMEDEKYNNVKSNMIQLDDGTFIKESLPEIDISPKRNLFKLPTLNITSTPNTELRRPDFKIGNPIIPDDMKDKIKGLVDYNDYHWVKSATDLLSTGLSTFNNLYYLNRMKEPPRPAVNPGVKLKTKWNNNATLSAIRESLGNTITDLARNTASSQNLRNSINQARINALGLINKSNEDKENKETELINANSRQRATTIKDNVDNYNTWRNAVTAFRNNIFDKRSETWNNMMSNVNKVVNEAIENREQRDAERRQFDFLSYAYPIVRNNPAISNYLYDILFGKNNINIKSR